MDAQRQEYAVLLAALEPEEAVNVLGNRVALINQINSNIADFLEERRRIEERYAADLRKLARRPQQDANAALGIFQMPWQRIVSGTENLAQSHETLASKIQADVELPLRQFSSKSRELEAISTTQGNLSSLAKDVTRAKEKVEKMAAKSNRKAEDANSEVEEATKTWQSQSPPTFIQLQTLDEMRIEHLRGVLTQLQTHEADQVERNRASAESCLNALLNIETADEIKTFAEKVQQGRSTAAARRMSAATSRTRPSTSSNVPPVPPPPRNQESRNRAAASAASAAAGDEVAALPEPPPHKSKMGGLKRLGTVMRRKSAAPPPPTPSTEKKKEKRSIFRRGDSSRSFQDLEETGRDLAPIQSRTEETQPQQAPASAEPAPQEERSGGAGLLPIPNGLQDAYKSPSDELPQPLEPTPAHPVENSGQHTGSSAYTIAAPPISAATDPFAPPAVENTATAPDSEDASRNLRIRDKPIQDDADEAQVAMNNMANQLRLQAQTSGLNRSGGSVRGRRDVRNTMFIPGNQEISSLANPSNAGFASPLSAATLASPMTPPQVSMINSEPDPEGIAAKRAVAPGAMSEDHSTVSDTTSIHSAQSLAPITQHPELHEPGLNASIVETVNTWFSDTGVSKSFVIGEIALSYITSPTSTPQDQDTIRLQNFQTLEKVAANPTFVSPYKSATASAEEQAGIYTVSLAAIRRTMPTVGLKYQLHLNESNIGQCSPLLISPAWKIVAGQASVAVFYSLNPAFSLPPSGPSGELSLKNVVVSVNLNVKDATSGKPTTARMAPTTGASFRRKAGAMIWRFPELRIKLQDPSQQQDKLLVQFTTEGEAPAKKGSIEIKFELPNATAGGLGVERSTGVEADPFADAAPLSSSTTLESTSWSAVPTKRMLMSGRYTAA